MKISMQDRMKIRAGLGLVAMIFPKVKKIQAVAVGALAALDIIDQMGPLGKRLENAAMTNKGVHLSPDETMQLYTLTKVLEESVKGL